MTTHIEGHSKTPEEDHSDPGQRLAEFILKALVGTMDKPGFVRQCESQAYPMRWLAARLAGALTTHPVWKAGMVALEQERKGKG